MKTMTKTGPVRSAIMVGATLAALNTMAPLAEARAGAKPANYCGKGSVPAWVQERGPANVAVLDSTSKAINQVIQIINMNQGNPAVVSKYKSRLAVLVKLARERNVKLDESNALIAEALGSLKNIEGKVDAIAQGQQEQTGTLKQIEKDVSRMVNRNAVQKFFVDVWDSLGTLGGIILGAAAVGLGYLLGRGIRRRHRRLERQERHMAAMERNSAQTAENTRQSDRRLSRVEGQVRGIRRDVRAIRNQGAPAPAGPGKTNTMTELLKSGIDPAAGGS